MNSDKPSAAKPRDTRMSTDSATIDLDAEDDLLCSGDETSKRPQQQQHKSERALPSTIESLGAILLDIREDNKKYKSETNLRLHSLERQGIKRDGRLDAVEKTVQQLEDQLKKNIADAMQSMETKIESSMKKVDIDARLEIALQSSNDWNEQYKLRNNISIANVPRAANENVVAIVVDICNKLDANISSADVKAYRVRDSATIIVKFASFETKAALMKTKLVKRLKVSDVPSIKCASNEAHTPIYVNSQVTPPIAFLLQRCRQAKTERKITAHWLVSKGVMIKVKPDDDAVAVHSVSELNKLIGVADHASSTSGNKRMRNANESMSPKDADTQRSKRPNMNEANAPPGPKFTKEKKTQNEKRIRGRNKSTTNKSRHAE